eukprot:11184277-Lingulodinium_polyedra.AAC.1
MAPGLRAVLVARRPPRPGGPAWPTARVRAGVRTAPSRSFGGGWPAWSSSAKAGCIALVAAALCLCGGGPFLRAGVAAPGAKA